MQKNTYSLYIKFADETEKFGFGIETESNNCKWEINRISNCNFSCYKNCSRKKIETGVGKIPDLQDHCSFSKDYEAYF